MSVRKPVALDTEAKRPKVGGSEVAEQLSSPRVRASLVGGPSTGEGGGFSSAKAVAAAAAAAQRGAVDGVGSTISGLAPRCAGAQLTEVRAAFGMTPAQFAEQLRGDKPTDKNAKPLEPVTAKALNKWETCLARVPMRVYQLSQRLHSQLLRELQAQACEPEALQPVAQVYPRQESMVGSDFQAVVPKHIGSSSASGRQSRKDESLWSPRMAVRHGVVVEEYLSAVRGALEGAPTGLEYDETEALHVLRILDYEPAVALRALEWAVGWRAASVSRLAELQRSGSDGGRAAAVNAILWLHRLTVASRGRAHRAGVYEALHAGLLRHGKDLAGVRRTHLPEKTVHEVIDLYYRAPGRYTDCVSVVEEDRLAVIKEDVG